MIASPGSELSTTSTPWRSVAARISSANVERAGVVNVLDAERTQEVAFLVAAGRGKNFGADLLSDLNRRQAHAAGAGVNQHPLARLQMREPHQGVVGGEERDRDGAGFVVVDRRRLGHQRILGRAGVRGKA